MNILRFVTLFAMFITLSGCGAGVNIKDATGFVAGQVISNASDSDNVIVHDARINKTDISIATNDSSSIQEVHKPSAYNWNGSDTQVTTGPSTNPITKPNAIEIVKEDKASTLAWFFFAMMLMGMLGAGIIGLIEAISGRNSLSTEQEVRTAPIQEAKPRIKLNEDGTTTDV